MGGRNIKPYLSVYGHVSIDQIIDMAEFPEPNRSMDILSKTARLGGIATGISVRAAAFGVPTAICVFVGSDFPKMFEDLIKENDVITDELIKVDDLETSTAVIINNSKKEQMVCFFQGAQGCAMRYGRDLLKNATDSDVVHFSTGDPDYYIRLMEKLQGGERKISFDPAQEIRDKWQNGRFQKGLEMSDRLWCNEFEAAAVRDYLKIDSLSEIDKDLVVCTKGDRGSEAYLDGTMIEIPAIRPRKVVDPTGAGDAYRSGFYAGQYHNYSVEQSLVLGASAASFAVEAVGSLSNIPTWDDVLERADKELMRF